MAKKRRAPKFTKKLQKFRTLYKENKREAIKTYAARPDAVKGSLFRALSRRQTQYLTLAEIRPFARRLGMSGRRLFKLMDTNGDGRVSRAEFMAYLRKYLVNE